jgi:hypothetical protein
VIQTRELHLLTDEHRRELVADARSHRVSVPRAKQARATQRSAAGIPVTGGRAVRQAVAPRVGAWLIEAGTRLGGASVRTS